MATTAGTSKMHPPNLPFAREGRRGFLTRNPAQVATARGVPEGPPSLRTERQPRQESSVPMGSRVGTRGPAPREVAEGSRADPAVAPLGRRLGLSHLGTIHRPDRLRDRHRESRAGAYVGCGGRTGELRAVLGRSAGHLRPSVQGRSGPRSDIPLSALRDLLLADGCARSTSPRPIWATCSSQAVEVTVDSWPSVRFAGRVVQVSHESDFTPRNIQSDEGARTAEVHSDHGPKTKEAGEVTSHRSPGPNVSRALD